MCDSYCLLMNVSAVTDCPQSEQEATWQPARRSRPWASTFAGLMFAMIGLKLRVRLHEYPATHIALFVSTSFARLYLLLAGKSGVDQIRCIHRWHI